MWSWVVQIWSPPTKLPQTKQSPAATIVARREWWIFNQTVTLQDKYWMLLPWNYLKLTIRKYFVALWWGSLGTCYERSLPLYRYMHPDMKVKITRCQKRAGNRTQKTAQCVHFFPIRKVDGCFSPESLWGNRWNQRSQSGTQEEKEKVLWKLTHKLCSLSWKHISVETPIACTKAWSVLLTVKNVV